MAKITKATVIDKYSKDRPGHNPLDPDKRSVLIIRHSPTGFVIRTWGWTLNEVLTILDWKHDDILATFVRPFSRSSGAVPLTLSEGFDQAIASLNDQ